MSFSANSSKLTYHQLEANIVTWTKTAPYIQAVIMVGSRARSDFDQWSDLDLILFTTAPQVYIEHTDWFHTFGQVCFSVLNHTSYGDPEWFILFEGGLKTDIVLSSFTKTIYKTFDLEQILLKSPYKDAFQDGMRVIFDKTVPNKLLDIVLPSLSVPPPPTSKEFDDLCHRFFLVAYQVSKFLNRQDLWRAKHYCDNSLKQYLLKLLAWHSRATKDPNIITWDDGRHLNNWADPRAIAALADTFAIYTQPAIWQALSNTLTLFRWLAIETAQSLGYEYPTQVDEQVMKWMKLDIAED